MAIAFVASVSAHSGANGFTSGAIDTTGADLLVVVLQHYQGAAMPTVSDSKSNTWTQLTDRRTTGDAAVVIFYAKNATVGASHTFTVAGTSTFPTGAMLAFSGSNTTAPFDAENGNVSNSGGTSNQVGSVSPSENGEVFVTGISGSGTDLASIAIDSSFTLQESHSGAGAVNGLYAAYLIQTSAGAVNPTWSWTGSVNNAAAIATFKAAAVGGTTRGAPFGSRGTAFNGGRTFMGILR